MNNFKEIIISMIGTIAVIDLIAIILQGTKKILKKGGQNGKFKVALNLGIIGGLFGIYATLNGYTISSGSVISIRDVGPMMAGCLGGPLGGFIAGLIAGVHRLYQGLNSSVIGTAVPCSIATLLIGLCSGLLFKPFESKKSKGIFAFVIAIIMEILHLLIVFIYTWITDDILTSYNLILDVAPSFLFSNALGFGLMIFTTDMIDKYKIIENKKDMIEMELNTAADIQKSMIPEALNNISKKNEFDIYANMVPAKQVGGDFYDYYYIDDDHFAFLIADVSGKGVPAALFMAISKIVIKCNLQMGLGLKEAVEKANNELIEDNKESMFVTMWLGVLEISTGKLQYINAGHNPPILKNAMGDVCYLKDKSGFVLAGMNNSKYTSYALNLKKGDMLFLYTDGVTEALNKSSKQYGEQRLMNVLSDSGNLNASDICKCVEQDLDSFCQEAEQFDDITMLAFKYNGNFKKSKSSSANSVTKNGETENLKVEADIKNIDKILKFVHGKIDSVSLKDKTKYEVDIVLDEIFTNICKYAYTDKASKGDVNVYLYKSENPLVLHIVFEDSGIKYNPLEYVCKEKKTSVNEMEYGGHGIEIVKKLCSDIQYEYVDGKNVLHIQKLL